jgi:hypothetical protein
MRRNASNTVGRSQGRKNGKEGVGVGKGKEGEEGRKGRRQEGKEKEGQEGRTGRTRGRALPKKGKHHHKQLPVPRGRKNT